ncbi:alpha/beta hydrolase [Nocardia sp. NEAU-G5]|uniref:Alpha/beta hydrolase n=1 Tax=Nocardia albiluteola TaxID=2842303 RepID=A0ABS6AQE9_9NOCA|nr:alpha/beta hydrolase fold domain-containing protein [Nocardia albiluteola]MBU3060245.1 alpha/beta hydrolase [Nocardia albiluteola]
MAAVRVDEIRPEPGVVVNPDGGSLASRALLLACQGVVGPFVRHYPVTPLTMPLARIVVDGLSALRPMPRGIEREQVRLQGFRMEIIRPAGARRALRDGVVMYLHGGGFFLGGLDSHRPIAAAIARRTGLAVVNVEYRQLPGTPIAGSVRDCLTAYRWLLRHGADAGRIVFAGDSAGGYLSFATALRAVESGLPAPAGLVGLSPLLDLDCAAKREYANVRRDPYIPLTGLAKVVEYGGEGQVSPVDGALGTLPPALLIVGEDELLRYDCELMARRLTAAGVPNSLELWRGQVHAFMSIAPSMPESRVVLGRVARFVRARIEAEAAARTA